MIKLKGFYEFEPSIMWYQACLCWKERGKRTVDCRRTIEIRKSESKSERGILIECGCVRLKSKTERNTKR